MELWITRDLDENLTLHFYSPTWIEKHEYWHSGRMIALNDFAFPEVTFKNSPQQIELKLVKEE